MPSKSEVNRVWLFVFYVETIRNVLINVLVMKSKFIVIMEITRTKIQYHSHLNYQFTAIRTVSLISEKSIENPR